LSIIDGKPVIVVAIEQSPSSLPEVIRGVKEARR
jgi:hypothetical protein